MTQHDLAGAVGMPQSSIARIERGLVIPRGATLIQLLAATGHRLTVEPIGPPVDRKAIQRRLAMAVPQRTRSAIGGTAREPMKSPIRILRRLRRFGVPFVLVGELAEVAHGSPGRVRPGIVEVCHAQTEPAHERLALALDDLGPAANRLRLMTETAAGDDYQILARNAVRMHVDSGILVHVAAIEDLIRIRRTRCTPQDLEAAAVLDVIATGRRLAAFRDEASPGRSS